MKYSVLIALSLLAFSCSGDDEPSQNNTNPNNTNNPTNNNASNNSQNNPVTNNEEPDMGEDVITINNMNNDPIVEVPCFDEIKDAWPLHAAVSTGTLTSTEAAGVYTAQIDASAGGSMQSASNPFIYLDLDTGTKVEVTDFEAYENTTWDLAFKRVSLRSNSASSGPGQARVARLTETTFDAVTAVPGNVLYEMDETADDDCMIALDSINLPMTAFNFLNLDNISGSQSWYSYGAGGVEIPPGHIYLVRNAEGTTTYKMEIQGWASGVYTLRWAPLP